jgi:adenylate cyclase
MGDGLLADFSRTVNAVKCAVEVQQAISDREHSRTGDDRICLRIGINLGDVIIDGGDIFGDGVNIAARLEGLAEPNGICLSGTAFDTVDGKLDYHFEGLGPQKVKNIAKPVRAYHLSLASHQISEPGVPLKNLSLPDKPSIAILPFANLSGDPDQDYFADG